MIFFLFLVPLLFLGASCNEDFGRGSSPHIIFLIADDLGYNDVGFSLAGNSGIPTPNLDQLARDGVVLDRQYTQPFCSPTRSTLMTGSFLQIRKEKKRKKKRVVLFIIFFFS